MYDLITRSSNDHSLTTILSEVWGWDQLFWPVDDIFQIEFLILPAIH